MLASPDDPGQVIDRGDGAPSAATGASAFGALDPRDNLGR
jgi:hypothetical protein